MATAMEMETEMVVTATEMEAMEVTTDRYDIPRSWNKIANFSSAVASWIAVLLMPIAVLEIFSILDVAYWEHV